MTPQQICAAFMHLAADGLDHPLVERPVNVRVNMSRSAPEQLYAFDRKIPHRIPAIVHPVGEPEPPLGYTL